MKTSASENQPEMLETAGSTVLSPDLEHLELVDVAAIKLEARRFQRLTQGASGGILRTSEIGALWVEPFPPGAEPTDKINDALRRASNRVVTTLLESRDERLEKWRAETKTKGLGRASSRALTSARCRAREAFPKAWQETLEFFERSRRALQSLQNEARQLAGAFTQKQSKSIRPEPSVAELEDLARRLFETLFLSSGPDESTMEAAAKKNPILRDAMRTYEKWRANLNVLSQRNGATRPGYVAGSDPDSETNTEKELYSEAARQNAVTHTRTFAFHWPRIVEAWTLERRPTAAPRWPAMLATTGGIAPLYGRKIGKVQRVNTGLVEHIIVSSKTGRGGGQLRLDLAASVELPDRPTNDEILAAVASVTGNRVFRFFGVVLVAMSDDAASGIAVPGGFYYTPARFADLMGVDSAEWSKDLDRCLRALTGVSLTASLKVAGKPYKVQAESLIIDGRGSLEATGERGRGRPKARLFRVQDFVLQLLGEQAAWFPFSRSALAPPPGVDQRVWDDAFKVYLTLGSLARLTKARPGKWWRNEIAKVLEVANVTKKTARPYERRAKLEELCGYLRQAGLLAFEMTEDHLLFDLPAQRPALESISTKRKPSKRLPPAAGA